MTTSKVSLQSRSCMDKNSSDARLPTPDLQPYFDELNGWEIVEQHHLKKQFKCRDFLTALALTNAIGGIAEEEGHHPDIGLSWGLVTVDLWTHSVGGLSEYDFIVAAKIDALATRLHPQFAPTSE